MIADLEQAVAEVLAAALAEYATLAGVRYVVLPATTRAEVPGDRAVVCAKVQSGQRVIGLLLDPIVEIIVGTPAKSEATSVEAHAAIEAALTDLFTDPAATVGGETLRDALSDAIEANVVGYTGGGYFCQGWQPGSEENQWVPRLEVKIGAVRE